MKISMILLWLLATNQTVEFSVGARTFQVCGDQRMSGQYERFFEGAHTTRRKISEIEAEKVFSSVKEVMFFETPQEGVKITRDDLESRVKSFFK